MIELYDVTKMNIIGCLDQGMTIVMVTHDPDIAAQCERIVHIKDGLVAGDEFAPDGNDGMAMAIDQMSAVGA